MDAIVMTESYWANSQLSIARYYGSVKLNGHTFVIVDKDTPACISFLPKRNPGRK